MAFLVFILPFVLPFLDVGCCRYPLLGEKREREIEKTLPGLQLFAGIYLYRLVRFLTFGLHPFDLCSLSLSLRFAVTNHW